MGPKYELTAEVNTNGLYRIRALRDIPLYGVKAGDLGGWVASEGNLSQAGDAWVTDSAWVYGSALVAGSARVYDSARVTDSARVSGDAQVYGDAWVSGDAQVYGDAWVYATNHAFAISGKVTPNAYGVQAFRLKGGGHSLSVGCWEGTAEELSELADSEDWPSGGGADYRAKWAPSLRALAAYVQAVVATWDPAEGDEA